MRNPEWTEQIDRAAGRDGPPDAPRPRAGRGRGAGEWLRRGPLGVLALGSALLLLGTGFMAGGIYLALTREGGGWMAWLAALAVGPLILYIAVHVIRLSHWAWLALVGLAALLIASAVIRLFFQGPHPVVPLVEIAIEAASLLYLTRPRVRQAFGRR